VVSAAAASGFAPIDHFTLPASAWAAYYDPLLARADALAAQAGHDRELADAIADTRREADLWRRCGHTYDYVFYLLRAR
jgi:hypothetical protein